MQSVLSLFRLGLGGLFLEPQAYREQRDAPDGMRRGFALVALTGLIVGLAALLGNLGEYLAQPSSDVIITTIRDGLQDMPWYTNLAESVPGFTQQFAQIFDQIARIISITSGGGLVGSLGGVLLTPLLFVLGWLLFGAVAHVVARSLGGRAGFSQTLACTALSAGAGLLNIVQIVPFAQVSGTTLLGLVACYVAVREAHGLPPWRAFWATVLGPVLLGLLFVGLFCAAIFFAFSAIGAAIQEGGFQ